MILEQEHKKLTAQAVDIVGRCFNSAGERAALCRQQYQWVQSGRANGVRALINLLYAHLDRKASHLFSPSELRFTIDFENHYPKDMMMWAERAARKLTREWERQDIDMVFAEGVFQSLQYGCVIPKLINGHSGLGCALVMPWQFGVWREDKNALGDQDAVAEKIYMTMDEVWRRISHLPDAEKLYNRIKSYAKQAGADENTNFFHQVLSTSTLNTSGTQLSSNVPGGLVQLSADPGYAIMGPTVDVDMVCMNEIWVNDTERDDYTLVQLIEPDVLIAPIYKRTNPFAPHTLPYGIIQPNRTANYFWGRSEIADLVEPQGLLAQWADDIRRLISLQYDKLLAFPGYDGITDEIYDQFRGSGYAGLPPGASVQDLTPQIPAEAFTAFNLVEGQFDKIAGFGNILSGQGEAGVRAGVHADTLLRTASPRLRDGSLVVERQCADFADKTLEYMEAHDSKVYWTDPTEGQVSEFLLSQLPEDRRVSVDSHSSSPIYEQDHRELVAFGLKAGMLTPDSGIDLLPFPQKDILKARYREAVAEKKAALQQEKAEIIAHPDAAKDLARIEGGKRR